MKVTIGCDPEVFLHDGLQFVSAYGLFPGTKKEPHKVDKGAVQVDGMALEFNIDPANNEDEFNINISTVLTQMDEMVKKVSKELSIKFIPVARFDAEYFKLQPQECKILGCDPDYSSFDGTQKVPSGELEFRPLRTGAGHIHIGWTEGEDPFEAGHFNDCRVVAHSFRYAKYFSPKTKEELERVRFYGTPGSFRPKAYGVELRTPSNLWVSNEEDRRLMYRSIISRMEEVEKDALRNS